MRRLFILIISIFLFFSCSPHWKVSEIHPDNIFVNPQSGAVDSLVQAVLEPYRDSIEHDMSKFVTYSKSPLIKGKPESKLTNLIADLILESGGEYCKLKDLNFKPDASYVNYGGLRASLPQGEINVGHIFELMPFENEIVFVKITGDSFQQMADRIAGRGGEGISGMTIGIRDNKAGTVKVGGKLIEKSSAYWLVTNDYVANGGDQMDMLTNPLEIILTHVRIRDVIIELMERQYKKDGQLDVKEDGRIYHEQ